MLFMIRTKENDPSALERNAALFQPSHPAWVRINPRDSESAATSVNFLRHAVNNNAGPHPLLVIWEPAGLSWEDEDKLFNKLSEISRRDPNEHILVIVAALREVPPTSQSKTFVPRAFTRIVGMPSKADFITDVTFGELEGNGFIVLRNKHDPSGLKFDSVDKVNAYILSKIEEERVDIAKGQPFVINRVANEDGTVDVHLSDGTIRHRVGSDNLSDEDRQATDKQLDDWIAAGSPE